MDTTDPSGGSDGPRKTPHPSGGWHRKVRYHHGDLRTSALRRGREIVARHGPTALTLRGLARDLGVTAPALVYYFGSVAGLRAAVAASVLEEAAATCGIGETGTRVSERRTPKELGAAWIGFAAKNANLYRLACGEGWHQQPEAPRGFLGASLFTESPRRSFETVIIRHTRRYGLPKGDVVLARDLSCTIHGLALARLDGVPEEEVARMFERALAA